MGCSSKAPLALIVIPVLLSFRALPGADCNRNGIPDDIDLKGDFRFEEGESLPFKNYYPNTVMAADLDGDLKVDLVTTNTDANTLSILWNEGGGEFSGPSLIEAGDSAFQASTGDLDGDGRPELVVARRLSSLVSVLENDGSRTFEPPVEYLVGREPQSTVLSDFDRDGFLDLATANLDSVSVRLNQGNGQLAREMRIPIDGGPSSLASIDLDGDGDLDLAAGGKSLWRLRNNGSGKFTVSAILSGVVSSSLIAQDIDGNGYTDLAGFTDYHFATVFWNMGSGPGAGDRLGQSGTPGSPAFLFAGDFDGNGYTDLAMDTGLLPSTSFTFYLNEGKPKFRRADQDLKQQGISYAVADLDGDGDLDIAMIPFAAPWDHQVVVYLNHGDGTFDFPRAFGTEVQPLTVQPADLDGDGDADLILMDMRTSFAVLLNQGTGTFAPPVYYSSGGYVTILADLDRDGDLDIARSDDRRISVHLNRGDGSFARPVRYDGGGSYSHSLIAADLDGDGFPDLAAYDGRLDLVTMHFNKRDGSFADQVIVPGLSGALFAGDFDRDGNLDLASGAWTPAGIRLTLSLSQGHGLFQPPRFLSISGSAIERMVDLDSDGDLDILAIGPDDLISVYFNDGHGAFPTALRLTAGLIPYAAVAADLDDDGRPDLSALYQGTTDWTTFVSGVAVFKALGGGMFQDPVRYPIDDHPSTLEVADIDRDGDLDLVITYQSPLYPSNDRGSVAILRNRGDGSFVPMPRFPIGTATPGDISTALADLDGDGHLDLAVASANDHSLILVWNRVTPPTSLDLDQDGIPDECGKPFHRGDPDESGRIDINDPASLLLYLFLAGEAPRCRDSADANSDGALDVSDCLFLLRYLFLAGPPPGDPGPPGSSCGPDPDPPGSPGVLGCEAYDRC
jgi:VCBS repeat protein